MVEEIEIPEHWKLVELKELGEGANAIVDGPFGSNLKTSDYINDTINGVPVLTTKNLEGDYSEKSVRYISKQKFEQLKRSQVNVGDILVAKIGSIGKTGIYPKGHKTAIIPANLLKFTLSKKVNFNYVFFYLNYSGFQKKLKSISTATAQPAFNVTKFRSLKIPLAPFGEQNRIVSKLEELFSELDKGIEQLKTAQQQLKVYRQSVLKWAFEGKLTNENVQDGELLKGWKLVTINDIGKIKGGKRLPPKHTYSEPPTDYMYIMAGNLKDGTVKNKKVFIKQETYNALYNYRVNGGEVYITIVGACIGDAGVIPMNLGNAILTENAAKIIDLKNVYNKYLSLWINSHNCQQQIQNKILSATLGKLALARIGTIEVPIAPYEEQKQIVQEIESRLSVADKLEETINNSLQQAEALRQSILKKAFEGKLMYK